MTLRDALTRLQKAIDYEALEDAHEPKPGGGGRKGKAGDPTRPVGSRTDQAREETGRRQRAKNRLAVLKERVRRS